MLLKRFTFFSLLALFTFGFAQWFSQPGLAEQKENTEYKSLFDGKTLSGWKGDTKFWKVVDGTIVAESTEANPCKENNFLLWDGGKVSDFELKLKFKITGTEQANSGIQFRSQIEEDGHVVGYQADIDRKGKWIGFCYDEKGRGTLCKRGERVVMTADGKREAKSTQQSQKILKTIDYSDWNEYKIRAVGNHITLFMNGKECADVIDNDEKNRDLSGVMALQLHSGPPMKVEFKDIVMKTIASKETSDASAINYKGFSNDKKRTPEDGISKLQVYPGVEATLFATEPMLLNPTSIDIDHLGRVWVCEVVNYRYRMKGREAAREAGDRILVLEDTDGDGKAVKTTVFYQSRDIDSAHGICVYGDNVYVSTSTHVYRFTDSDHDLVPDTTKEVMFTAHTEGKQHDHALHALRIGPDGKMYFNFGNAGYELKDKDGKTVIDKAGNPIKDDGNPYRQGMVFRCNPDGSEVETLGWNFRNNWELAVDSFGNMWQSDNDDDGNRGVRINFVMEYGNYGYRDEMTGAGWRVSRTGQYPDTSRRHWHLKDPGVVPNLLQTGAGSPTGICIYEGTLLPEVFQNEMIHCDAGPNIVRAYPVSKQGAGFAAKSVSILDGQNDSWFRPSDIAVAPDGSVLVADWYDPGVGGHAMGDINKGRIFRLAPPNTKYKFRKPDYSTIDGAITALQSPNLETRGLAHDALHKFGWDAEQALYQLYESSSNPRMKARALWVIGKMDTSNGKDLNKYRRWLRKAMEDENEDLRIVAIRIARQQGKMMSVRAVEELANSQVSSSMQVYRALAIALSELSNDEDTVAFANAWNALANHYQGNDRWYLEALGIAARGHWDECLTTYLKSQNQEIFESLLEDPAVRDIIWRSRSEQTGELFTKILKNPDIPMWEVARYFRAFDFIPESDEKTELLATLAFNEFGSRESSSFISSEAINRLNNFDLKSNPKYQVAVDKILENSKESIAFVSIVDKFQLEDRYSDVLEIAINHSDSQLGVDAIRTLLAKKQQPMILKAIREGSQVKPDSFQGKRTLYLIHVLGLSEENAAYSLLTGVSRDENLATTYRREALKSAARGIDAIRRLVRDVNDKKIPEDLEQTVASILHSFPARFAQETANRLYPLPPTKNAKPLPSIGELAKLQGDFKKGRLLFHTTATCAKCHVVNEQGKEIGPDLSEIGKKLGRVAMYESILFPSAGISHNFESYLVVTNRGKSYSGVKVSETADSVTIKNAEGISREIAKGDIAVIEKQKVSMMPADLQKVMTEEELVDVVEYLIALKKSAKP